MFIYELLSPGAILVSALGAWKFASMSIESSERTARCKSTFDYISKLSWDKDYIEAKKRFLDIKVGTKKLRAVSEEYENLKLAGAMVDEQEKTKIINDHSAIKNILNEYEALAIAIRSKALDEQMMKDNIQQQFVDHIDACKEFIEHTRKQKDVPRPEKIWCEAQRLAEAWQAT